MSDPFYGRQQEVRQRQQRAQHRQSHDTMETVHIEQERAQIEKPYTSKDGDVVPPDLTLVERITGFIKRIFG